MLDHQLLDKDGRRCGNVDDLAIEGRGDAEVVAILFGPGYWPNRGGWLGRVAGRLGGRSVCAMPWGRWRRSTPASHLRADAPEYGLGTGDDRLRPLLEQHPGSEPVRTFSALVGREVETESGLSLGRCHDLSVELHRRATRGRRIVRRPAGMLDRLGIKTRGHDEVAWSSIVRIEGKRIVVRDP